MFMYSPEPGVRPNAAILIFSISASCKRFALARRFWNQILTCVSVNLSDDENSARSAMLKYCFSRNFFSNDSNCVCNENKVKGNLRLVYMFGYIGCIPDLADLLIFILSLQWIAKYLLMNCNAYRCERRSWFTIWFVFAQIAFDARHLTIFCK